MQGLATPAEASYRFSGDEHKKATGKKDILGYWNLSLNRGTVLIS